jgi:CSLREA domain-containing protein
MRGTRSAGLAIAMGALAIGLLSPAGAAAVTLTPNTTADEFNSNPAACSLREAIEAANADTAVNSDGCPAGSGADRIELQAGTTYTLSIPGAPEGFDATGDLDIRGGDLTIIAPQTGATIDGNGAVLQDRILEIANFAPAINVVIDNINFVNGCVQCSVGNGGAIAVNGITNAHKLTLIDSTLSGNRAITGGAMNVGAQSTAILQDVTISGNSATVDAGGLTSDGTTQLLNSTVTNNAANSDGDFIGGGGGLERTGGTLSIKNTIMAGNRDAGQGTNEPECDDASGTPTSQGNNLIGSLAGCETYAAGPGDQVNVTATGLLPLAANGGPVLTHALQASSPAVNKGSGCTADDARDVPRTGACDIGAYERAVCGKRVVNVVGTSGNDTLRGTSAKDGIIGLDGKDRLFGLAKGDGLCGGNGKDTLKGGKGKDVLKGGKGKDKLSGGKGKDKLAGGKGNDRCSGAGVDRLSSC